MSIKDLLSTENYKRYSLREGQDHTEIMLKKSDRTIIIALEDKKGEKYTTSDIQELVKDFYNLNKRG